MPRGETDLLADARRLRTLLRLCRTTAGEAAGVLALSGEADSALLAILEIALGHAQGVQALAEKHYRHGWAALCCARAAFEAGAVSSWIGTPPDPFVREGRWIGYYRQLERFYKVQAGFLEDDIPGIGSELQGAFSERDSAFKQLLANHPEIKVETPPSMRQMLKDSQYERLYAGYMEACEIVHAGPEAVIRVRHRMAGHENRRTFLYRCEIWPEDWASALRMAGWGATVATYNGLLRNGRTPDDLRPLLEAQKRFNKSLEAHSGKAATGPPTAHID
jgi:hypothetical protein